VKITRKVLFDKTAVSSAPFRSTDPGAKLSFGVRTGTDEEGLLSAVLFGTVSPEAAFFSGDGG
jgi:hypothetical protein